MKSSNHWSSVFDIKNKSKHLKVLEGEAQAPTFWDNQERATEVSQEIAVLKNRITTIENFKKELSDVDELISLMGYDSKQEKELVGRLTELEHTIEAKTQEVLLSGKYDSRGAILSIQSGAGGRDADDFAAMLLSMYQGYFDKRGWFFKILSQSFGEGGGPDGRIGVKEVSIEVDHTFAYGILKKETGVHRLVRISPFSAKHLRHTAFCKVEVLPKLKEIDFPEIKPDDLKIETFRSTGKGGQNVNKRETAIRIIHIPTGITVSCQQQRQQAQNKKIALGILAAKLLQESQLEKDKELKQIKGGKISAEFGHQIRSYILHPYKMVKDHRTQVETSNVEDVLNGELDKFIDAEIKMIS